MKNRNIKIVFWLVTILLSPVCLAINPTVSVSVSGPNLSVPIHSVNSEAITPNVWSDDFAKFDEGQVKEPPIDLPRYSVHFWVDLNGTTEMKYMVHFVSDPETNLSYVYLPGKLDRWYGNNVFTILRPGHDGNWFVATPQWSQAIKEVIGD